MSKTENNGLIASTTLNLYDSKRRLRQGVYDLFLWKDKEIDLSFKCKTPGLPLDHFYTEQINALLQKIGNKAPFDLMTQKGIKRHLHQHYLDSKSAYLEISFPFFEHQVLYYQSTYRSAKDDYTIPAYLKDKEIEYENTIKKNIGPSTLLDDRKIDFSYINDPNGRDVSVKTYNDKSSEIKNTKMIRVFDPVIMRKGNIKDRKENSNPILEKYYILTRTNDDNIAKGLNINAETHKEIIEIIEHPDFTALTKKEESLLWKYRYPIKADKQYRKAVVKFLRSVDWTKEKEENEAIEMLQDWEFDIEQAIPMLSVLFSANDLYPSEIQSKRCVDIRKCAIQVLNREDTETLLRIMLQLTQAYRYEKFSEKLLLEFFLSKVTKNHSISHTFYWSIKLEKDNKENDLNIRNEYEFLFNSFMDKLREDDPENLSLLERQWEFRNKLYDLSSYVKEGNKIKHKKHRLKEAINEGGKFDMTNFEPTPMPLDPSIFVCGLETEK